MAKRGLWADAEPVPPWDWRYAGGIFDTMFKIDEIDLTSQHKFKGAGI